MSTKIQVIPNGPLKVDGDFSILKVDGSEIEHKGETAFVCRCGHSGNKPFCDGSHKKQGFSAD